MRNTITLGLLGAAAITAGVLLVRQQQRTPERHPPRDAFPAGERHAPAAERQASEISLERIRALGY